MMRVLRADGRALLSVWVPAGPIDAVVGVIGRAMAAATGSTPTRFAWHDPDTFASWPRVTTPRYRSMTPN